MKHVEELAYEKGYRVTYGGVLLGVHGKPIYASASKAGRLRVTFRDGDTRLTVTVHRLQAYQKYGKSMYTHGIEVRHKDNNYKNNEHGNILLGTHVQNAHDIPAAERRRISLLGSKAQRSLSDQKAEQLRQDRASGMKYAELCSRYGLAKSTVSYIVNHITYNGV